MNFQDRKQRLVWGGLMVLLGIAWLLESFTEVTTWTWVIILGVAGLTVLVIYLTDLSNYSYLIMAYVLLAVCFMVALIKMQVLQDESIAVFVLSAVALPFLAAFIRNRADWGLLIPPYVLAAVAAMIYMIGRGILFDEFIAVYILTAIAAPFVLGFLFSRKDWGLLIPPYVLLAVAGMVGLIGAGVLRELLIPSYIMLAIALPFFLAFVLNRDNWWALIPGGIMAVIGFSFLSTAITIQIIAPFVLILVGLGMLVRQMLGRKTTPPPGLTGDEPPDR